MSFLFYFNSQMCPQPVLQGSFDCNFRILSKQKSLQNPQQALGQSALVRRGRIILCAASGCLRRRGASFVKQNFCHFVVDKRLLLTVYSFCFWGSGRTPCCSRDAYQQLYSRIEEYGGGKRADNAPKHHIVFCVKYARLIYDKRHDVGKANLKSDCKPTRFRAVQFSERSGDCRNAGGRKQIEGHKGISGQRSEHCSVHA